MPAQADNGTSQKSSPLLQLMFTTAPRTSVSAPRTDTQPGSLCLVVKVVVLWVAQDNLGESLVRDYASVFWQTDSSAQKLSSVTEK